MCVSVIKSENTKHSVIAYSNADSDEEVYPIKELFLWQMVLKINVKKFGEKVVFIR